MTMAFKEYLNNKVEIGLYNISYQYHTGEYEEIKVNYLDKINPIVDSESTFMIIASWDITFEPENPFDLSVSYFIRFSLKDEFMGKINLEDFKINELIKENPEEFIEDEMDRVSLLVAQITSSFANSPLITIPALHLQEINKSTK